MAEKRNNTTFHIVMCYVLILIVFVLHFYDISKDVSEKMSKEGWIIEKECIESKTVVKHELVSVILDYGSERYFIANQDSNYDDFMLYLDDRGRLCESECCEACEDMFTTKSNSCQHNCYITCYQYHRFVSDHDVFIWDENVCVKHK